jgi:hypothetical protein
MSTQPKDPKEINPNGEDLDLLLGQVQSHNEESRQYMSLQRMKFDEQESLLLGVPTDQITASTKSSVFDPRLSTIVFERAARVTFQAPRGDVMPVSEDDIGKAMLMNLALPYYQRNANEQIPYLMKLRNLDLYSLVHGSMFALVPWRVNTRRGYIGPELNVLPIRDCFPQPGVPNVDDMGWFQVRTRHSIDWLQDQDGDSWNKDALNELIDVLKTSDSGKSANTRDMPGTLIVDDGDTQSYPQRSRYPTANTGKGFPQIEVITEYRDDMWISWVPKLPRKKESKPLILRIVENAYVKNGLLPIVKKDCFPLIDSVIGLGEFERGKSLQFAINSLINLYLDGVKTSIYPPLHINFEAGNVAMSTIKWGPAEKWLMKKPNQDVQVMANVNPQGIQTFQSTYNFMLSALMNQAGTTEVSSPGGNTSPTIGRTPQAVDFLQQRENTRDAIDSFQMDRTLEAINERWIAMISEMMPEALKLRLFPNEIQEIRAKYKDVDQLVKDGKVEEDIAKIIKTGRGTVTPEMMSSTEGFDYYHEMNSTLKPIPEIATNELTSILTFVAQNPNLTQLIAQDGKHLDVAELFERLLQNTQTIKDPSAILKPIPTATPGQPGQPGQPQQPPVDQPHITINAKDVTPAERDQMLEHANIQPDQGPQGGAPMPGQPDMSNPQDTMAQPPQMGGPAAAGAPNPQAGPVDGQISQLEAEMNEVMPHLPPAIQAKLKALPMPQRLEAFLQVVHEMQLASMNPNMPSPLNVTQVPASPQTQPVA